MSEEEWTAHDVTDGRLFMYAASLWTLGGAVLLVAVEIAAAVGADLQPTTYGYIVSASFLVLLVGVFYEQLVTTTAHAILWVCRRFGLEVPRR
jgi:hypothetical protein